ncbi:MAG: penicillin acylase family protein [Pyrinomonadaceae bacterium]
MIKRTTLILILSLLILLLLPQSSFRLAAQGQTTAQVNSTTIRLAGLRAPVTVRRDERGIPYIEAANENDLYFAQGYATAQDRLWQMDLLRRTARGELAEIFGRAALEGDKRHRIYNFAGVAEAMLARTPQPVRLSLEAYARGVNAFLESRDEKNLPLEFRLLGYRPRAWQPSDSIVIGKLLAESLSTTWDVDIARAAFADVPKERLDQIVPQTSPLDVIVVGSDPGKTQRRRATSFNQFHRSEQSRADLLHALSLHAETARRTLEGVGLYAEELAASNNWVVAGRRTASGKPLLANDPHLQISVPSLWYMTHLAAPNLRVAGVTVPGAPGIILGHNDRIAWGATNLGPDVQDVYLEKFDKENPRRYMTPAGLREAEVRREEIKVRKGFADASTEIVPFEVTVTRNGPIIFESDGARYALRWTALDPQSVELEAFYAINRARSWNDFQNALRPFTGPTQNFVYADVDGHIGYYGAGRIPRRKTGDGALPYDGATDAGEWTSYIPFDKLPHSYAPASGIIVTANNRVVGRDYPYHLTHIWAAPYRARRIYDLLTAKEKLTVDDFRRIQADTYSIPDVTFTREVLKVARPLAASSPEWKAMVVAFDNWDGVSNADSRTLPLAVGMRAAFRRRILATAVGEERAQQLTISAVSTFIDSVIQTRPREWLPKEFPSYEALLLQSYRDARANLTKQLGADETLWTWGRTGQIRFQHPLASVPLIGSPFVIAPLPRFTNGSAGTVNVGASVSMRLIADTSDWDKTQQGIPLGQSGDPSSPHWKDQLNDWRNTTPRTFPFTDAGVRRATRETIVLAPASK